MRDAAEGEKMITYIQYVYIYIRHHLFAALCCMLHKSSLFSIYLYIDIKIASIFTVLR